MSGRSNLVILISLWLGGITQAGATILTFDDPITFYGSSTTSNFGTISTQGFDVAADGGFGHYLSHGAGFCAPPCPDNGSNYLLSWGATITISAQDNSPFSLLLFDAAEGALGLTQHWAEALSVTGTRDDGTTTEARFDLDWTGSGAASSNAFQTFATPGLDNLTSLSFAAIGGSTGDFSLDNILLVPALPGFNSTLPGSDLGVIATPLPAAGWLFASALLGFAGLGRRHRRRATD